MNRALTKADIVEAIYEKTDRNRADVKNTVEILLGLMKQAIKKDNALLVSGFGKFEAYDKEARKGRNPQTDETITLPPRKVVGVPSFPKIPGRTERRRSGSIGFFVASHEKGPILRNRAFTVTGESTPETWDAVRGTPP